MKRDLETPDQTLPATKLNGAISRSEPRGFRTEHPAPGTSREVAGTSDPVTGLANRLGFHERLQQALDRAARYDEAFAVLFIDLDHFKNVNDTLGHSAGDELLRIIGRRLSACVRKSDTVARLGGDEFTVILLNLKDPELIARVAQKLVRTLSQPYSIHGRDFYLSASLGIACFPDDGSDVEILVRNADIAMYEVKKNGRNGFHFYTKSLSDRAIERIELEDDLRKGLTQGQFEVYYQPCIDTLTQETVSAEALIRWRHPQKGLVTPDEFIPLAEETGLIIELDQWVLRTASRQAAEWQRTGYQPISIAVNLSMRQFDQEDLIDVVMEALVASNLDSRWLELELTESVFMKNHSHAKRMLEQMRQLGIRVAIDDFGTGYSSLMQLRQLPIDCLKIDQAFVREITENPDDAILVEAIIALGRKLNLTLVAEGVETSRQLEFLTALGCDRVQGYLFGCPLPASEFEAQVLKPAITTRQRTFPAEDSHLESNVHSIAPHAGSLPYRA